MLRHTSDNLADEVAEQSECDCVTLQDTAPFLAPLLMDAVMDSLL